MKFDIFTEVFEVSDCYLLMLTAHFVLGERRDKTIQREFIIKKGLSQEDNHHPHRDVIDLKLSMKICSCVAV